MLVPSGSVSYLVKNLNITSKISAASVYTNAQFYMYN